MSNLQVVCGFLAVFVISSAAASEVKALTNDIEETETEPDLKPAASDRSFNIFGKPSYQPQPWYVNDNFYPSGGYYPNTFNRYPSTHTNNWYPSVQYPNYGNRYPGNGYPSNGYPNKFNPSYWFNKLPSFPTSPTYPGGSTGGTNCIGPNCYQVGRYPFYSNRYPTPGYQNSVYSTSGVYPTAGYPTTSYPTASYPTGYPSLGSPTRFPVGPTSSYPVVSTAYPIKTPGNGGYGGYQGNGGLLSYSGYDGYYNSGNLPGNTGFGYQNGRLPGSTSSFESRNNDFNTRLPAITTPTSISRDA